MSEKKIKKKKDDDSSKGSPSTSPKSGSGRSSAKSSRRSKRQGSNVFSMFSQKQVAEFKEGFQMMDADKDGVLGKNDLRTTFDAIGKLTNEKELEEMLGEAAGPINFTQLLTLFAKRMSATGANDEDDVIIKSIKQFDNGDGEIDGNELRQLLMSCGQRFSNKEVDDAFDQMDIDDKNMIDTAGLIQLLTGKEEEDEPPPEEKPAAPAEEEEEE